ncbi:guanylate kinase [bacterium]|nr:guanylate kinase [bacterium]
MAEVKRQGLLVLISGPSGVGKGTVVASFMAGRSDCVTSVSATTRAPRAGEIDGQSYYFISRETFQEWVSQDRFLEWDEHFGNCYGTPRQFVEEQRAAGKHVILEIDVVGAHRGMEKDPDAVGIFVLPPSVDVLKERLVTRGTESEEQIRDRLERLDRELSFIDGYKYAIINDSLDDAVAQINDIFSAEMSATVRLRRDGVIAAIIAQPDGT